MEMLKIEPVVLNQRQAAALAGVSHVTMRQWMRQADFPAFRSGRRWLIPKEPFLAWLSSMARERAEL